MIPISIPHIFEFNSLEFQGQQQAQWKEIAYQRYKIDIEPTRLKNLRITLKPFGFSGNEDILFRVNFINLSHGEQSEIIYFNSAFEKTYKSDEGEFWMGHPFYTTSILFYPENLNNWNNFRFKATVYKVG